MLGVFIFMGIGLGLGLIFMIFEWTYACIRDVATKQGPKSYMQALGVRLARVCRDIFTKKKLEDDHEDDRSTNEATPIQIPPRIPSQWKMRSADLRQIRPSIDEMKGSVHEIDSYEVNV
ncbi:hypothetical protein AC249_AIPGENE11125 [Exaiptasia diaphana]|nr:hypothetical protein AC249_AIPGENE11125 [Exaiptasia diaphana]